VSTSAITGSSPTAAADTSNTTNNPTNGNNIDSGLGENAFLQLLVTQLKNQDPTQPQDSSQFLAQLAQFSQLEQLAQINTQIQQLVTLAGGSSSTSNSSDSSTSSTTGTTGGN